MGSTGRCVAWAASIAHRNDIGGKTPGSMEVDVSEIFQEGLRLSAVPLMQDGRPIGAVFDICLNVSGLSRVGCYCSHAKMRFARTVPV
ncbi:hydantoinase B/oxoprolinase family protein [Mesorhizobium australicum]|uniref:hydantoinase B/oxoprolinase family protein n=1 Tax=Mesorhizobium australicum TaxID=536018 RepID=UPI001FCDDB56|nr:hydantoinase B/oxoprolinase family protein [Mesorhizobium australicum]